MMSVLGPVPIIDRKVICPCGCNTEFQVSQVKGKGAAYMEQRKTANHSQIEVLKFLRTLAPGTEWTNRQLYSWMERYYVNQKLIMPFEFPRVQGAVSELQWKKLVIPTKYKFFKLTDETAYVKQVIDSGRF